MYVWVAVQVAYDASPHRNHAELGTGKRAPRWVQSGAQIVVPCTTPGRPLTLTLQGRLDGGVEPRACVSPARPPLQAPFFARDWWYHPTSRRGGTTT